MRWHTLGLACLLIGAPAAAQEPGGPAGASPPAASDASPPQSRTTQPDATQPDATQPDAAQPDAAQPDAAEPRAGEPDASDADPPDAARAQVADPPSQASPPGGGEAPAPRVGAALAAPQIAASPSEPEPVEAPRAQLDTELLPAAERPRGWRMPRETVRRPLTLPQGVLRFDSTIMLSAAPVTFGSRLYMSGYAAMAGGLFDDLEIGATPLGITWIPFGFNFSDPYVYARARALSGDVQLAFRAGTTIPGVSQVGVAQLDLGAELALLIAPIFRIDTGLDYGLLFSSPLHQRVGIPVRATIQAGIAAFGLTVGVYVFNDFDDVDVPLLARMIITFRGYQGPHGEWSLEGGFTDLEHAENAWTIQSRFTFFAYL